MRAQFDAHFLRRSRLGGFGVCHLRQTGAGAAAEAQQLVERRENAIFLPAISRGDFQRRSTRRDRVETVAAGGPFELVGGSAPVVCQLRVPAWVFSALRRPGISATNMSTSLSEVRVGGQCGVDESGLVRADRTCRLVPS